VSIVQPYQPSLIKVTVSRVDVDANGVAKVIWSKTKNGTVQSGTVTLPAALNTANTSVIWAQSQYTYTPTIGYVITGPLTLHDQIYMRPRLSDTVACNAC
jgi:Flp pilus assembly protein TadG